MAFLVRKSSNYNSQLQPELGAADQGFLPTKASAVSRTTTVLVESCVSACPKLQASEKWASLRESWKQRDTLAELHQFYSIM